MLAPLRLQRPTNRRSRSSNHALIYPFVNRHGRIKNYAKAFPTLIRVAREGDTYAQNVLGYCFDEGCGVRQNVAEAMRWYRLAAKGGSVERSGILLCTTRTAWVASGTCAAPFSFTPVVRTSVIPGANAISARPMRMAKGRSRI